MDQINFKKIFLDSLGELQGLLQIPSVYDEKTVSGQMPYGEGSWRVLDYMREMGLKYWNMIITLLQSVWKQKKSGWMWFPI